jgi:hypothetical protein
MRFLRTITCVLIAGMFVAVGGQNVRPAPSAPNDFDPLDFYGHISWEDEKARLDNFANELRYDPNLVGYILVYAGRRSCAGEARDHARRAKDYLVKTRHIQESRVKAIDDGFQEEFRVILQPWLSSVGAFTPSSTLKSSDVAVRDCKPKSTKRRKRGS